MRIIYRPPDGRNHAFLKLPDDRQQVEETPAVVEEQEIDTPDVVTPPVTRPETDDEFVGRIMPGVDWMPYPDDLPEHFEVDWQARTITPLPAPPVIVTADDVRRECARRILAFYPEWKQRSDQQELVTPQGPGLPGLLHLVENGSATPDQQARYDAIMGRIRRKDDLVWCSNNMEPDPPSDYRDNSRWDRTSWQ